MSEEPNQTQPTNSQDSAALPKRFHVSRSTIIIDKLMNHFILVGGIGVILAVFGIFFFILGVIIPLFGSAKVEFSKSTATNLDSPILIGTDEWSEKPFVIEADGEIHFFDNKESQPIETHQIDLPADTKISSTAYIQESQMVFLGLESGGIKEVTIGYEPQFFDDGSRIIDSKITLQRTLQINAIKGDVTAIDALVAGEKKTIIVIVENEGTSSVVNQTYERKRSLFGKSDFKLTSEKILMESENGVHPVDVMVGSGAARVVVRQSDDQMKLYTWAVDDYELTQTFRPFENASITAANFIQGKNSISLVSDEGDNVIYNLYRSPTNGNLEFGQIKTLENIEGSPRFFAHSLRNKAYLIGTDEKISLRYLTTGKTRWSSDNSDELILGVINGKFDTITALDKDFNLRYYSLDDPHPEAGFAAFFQKIWYEGQDKPDYIWQSTGGSDDFEPKLSLIPLIFGSFKGTLYAMLFSVPIALLAAVYTSQFLNPGLKKVIKPTMEIMASLPSVVLGFIGALWLAPILETKMPSLILSMVAIPTSAILIGYLWNLLPLSSRKIIPLGWEFVIFVPALIAISYVAWQFGPLFEKVAFRVTDPSTGIRIADFRLWWESIADSQFQQRNSLVVGFMMGFAVIPIIYTIAEDAMSAVPKALTSGSLALGASRWQTTARVVLPTAFAGIFSALMIGLGRAVGETMIVVMATGNTAIMDLDIFSGMRTLSANIAVELPEAPHSGTLYRSLFLGAFVLFVLTFFVNTVAEILRARIRDRFKVVS